MVAGLSRRWHLDWSLRAAWGHVTLLMRGDGRPTTIDVREAVPVTTNMRRVVALMAQAERLAAAAPTDAVRAEVDAAEVLPPLATPIFALAAGLDACALAVIFAETRGSAMLLIAAAAVIGAFARRTLDHLGSGLLAQDFCAALIAGFSAAIAARVGMVADVRLVALCPCMILIPGPHLLNGAIDLLARASAARSSYRAATISCGWWPSIGPASPGPRCVRVSSTTTRLPWWRIPAKGRPI